MPLDQNAEKPDGPVESLTETSLLDTDVGAADDDLPVDLEADFIPLGVAEGDVAPHELDPFQYDSLQAQEAFDHAVELANAEDEEAAVQEFIRASKIAETAREWHLAAVACQRVGDFLMRPPPPCDMERAFRMYRRAIGAYEQSGLFAEARDLAYRVMYYRMRNARELQLPLLRQLELRIYWLTAGFGYRPARVIGSAMIIVLAYGLLYWSTNGVVVSHTPEHIDLWHAIYFSGITFATVGYGDLVPARHVQFFALSESFLGVFTLGLFVAVLANRLNRA